MGRSSRLRLAGIVLVIAGVMVLAVSLAADVIGIGGWSGAIGWKQLLGAAYGLAVVLVGVILARHGRLGR